MFATFADAAQAPRVSIGKLIKDWKRYDGKLLRLRGQIDNCYSNCALCPEEMTPAQYDRLRCIDFGFGPEPWDGSRATAEANAAMADAYRFATVTIEARFNRYCFPGDSKLKDSACLVDSAPPNLRAARIIAVHSRKSAREGLADDVIAALTPASGEDRDTMLAEFSSIFPDGSGAVEMLKADLPKSHLIERALGASAIGDGMGCVCLEEACQGRWPTRLFPGMSSAGNPFRCWQMIKTDSGWRVVPNFLQ